MLNLPRISGGFYELSDTGSCNSMCSDSPWSSQGSLVYRGQPGQGKGSRPQSADEITVRMAGLVPQGRRPGRGIKTTADPVPPLNFGRLGFARPRPVSTGDLERLLPLQECRSSEQKDVRTDNVLDWKFCCNLVSKNGGDVYNYPSPLHAVALQSPLFSLSGRVLGVEDQYCLPGTALTCLESKLVPTGCFSNQTERAQLSRAGSPNAVCEGMLAGPSEAQKHVCVYNKIRGKLEKMPVQCWGDSGLQGKTPAKANLSHRELTGSADISAPNGRLGGDSEVACGYWQLRPAVKGLFTSASCLGLRVAHGASSSSSLPRAQGSGSCLGLSTNQGAGNCLGVPTTQGAGSRYGLVDLSISNGAPGLPGADISHRVGRNRQCGVTWDGFVQARFVGPESQLRLPRCPPSGKAKVTRIKRRGSGVGPEAVLRAATEGNRPGKRGGQLQCSPPTCVGREPAMRPSPPPVDRVASGLRPAPQRRVGRRHSGSRGACARRRREPGSRLSGFSDSEQSDRGSPSRSAVASSRSSENECSDHTADRFGDAESSGSDCGQPAPRTGDRGRRSEARICRIKASRALKKKIRKFQPEALKVMTTV
ncbi:dapper homolog 2-like isoform X2 [Hypanus sabinus]|uniref:dapper homolog 2-like isoform X2 n=1 Tax=Hypanus sabinus TaxID=79690 RepID=UPI0028C4122A|nr:dapper homolog 2-like isoform X2 [Hypanus sabinus]